MSDPDTHPEEQAADREYVDQGEESEIQPDEREESEDAEALLDVEDLPGPDIGP